MFFLKPDLSLVLLITFHGRWFTAVCTQQKKPKQKKSTSEKSWLVHGRYKQPKSSSQRNMIFHLCPKNNSSFITLVSLVLFLKICCMCKRAPRSIYFFQKLQVSQPYQKIFSKAPCKSLGFQFKCVCTI